MIARQKNNIQCEWFKDPDRDWLKKVWQALEKKADANFFLSWLWVGTWLDCFVDHCHVIEARKEGQTVGLGIIVTKPSGSVVERLRVKHYLHRTGITEEDQIWIEYNDFLICTQDKENIRQAMFSSVAYWIGKTGAFIVGASKP